MKLYTDKGNTNTLKLLIANELKLGSLDIIIIKPEEKISNYLVQKLPCLEVLNGTHIVSPNAAARYIYGSDDDHLLVTVLDEWLEWEATFLQPVVHALSLATTSVIKADLGARLSILLEKLENTIQNNPAGLIGPMVTIADIVVWCSLYPLYCSGTPHADVVSKFPGVQAWFTKFHGLGEVTNALQKLDGPISYDVLKVSLQGQPQTPLPGGERSKPQQQTKVTTSKVDNIVTLPSVSAEEAKEAASCWNTGKARLPLPQDRTKPLLPQDGERNILICSALPYVNNVPHLGNIIGCVLSADVFARFCRLRNLNTLYICGTDEYGTATETKAMEEGVTPQQICDKYNALHTEIYQWFNIAFDHFGRTTTTQQTEIAQDIFWKLHKNGYILEDSIDQLLCQKCTRFLADRFVEGTCPYCAFEDARGDQCDNCGKLINAVELIKPRCKQCQNTPVVKTSQHLFMDLPKLEPMLEAHLNKNFNEGMWTSNSKIITKSWLRDGLKPRCISRDLKWGTPVPLEGYTDKVFYVWYDAPIGYISITANYTDQWKKWWQNPEQVELFNFMAKDNVPFHSVIFPSTLLGTKENWTVVNHLSATEYLNYEDTKFSKSRGVGVFGSDAMDTDIPADVWRFYLLFLRPENQDSAFSWDDFMMKNNSELLNNLGNFINRALMFVSNSFNATIPEIVLQKEDTELLALITKELHIYIDNLANMKLRDGLRNILTISRYGNQYIQANKPWVKVKGSPEDKVRAGTIVGLGANIACLLSVLLQPYMPAVSETIQAQLAAPPSCNIIHDVFVQQLPAGHKIGKPSPLFQKIEACTIQALKSKFAGKMATLAGSTSSSVPSPASAADITKLEEAIANQGNVVRKLKTEKAEKSQIDVEVAKLLDLKKQLTTATRSGNNTSGAGGEKKKKKKNNEDGGKATVSNVTSTPVDPVAVERLTKEVAQQGNVVRKLKTEKAEKSQIDVEVTKLLDLKKQLTSATGSGNNTNSTGGEKKKKKKNNVDGGKATVSNVTSTPVDPVAVERLTKEVAQQGEEVRKVKAEKAEKLKIDQAIAKLLDLKRQLAVAQGLDPEALVGGGKKKGKNK